MHMYLTIISIGFHNKSQMKTAVVWFTLKTQKEKVETFEFSYIFVMLKFYYYMLKSLAFSGTLLFVHR